MKKLLLTAATMIAFASPAMAQRPLIDDHTLQAGAMLMKYSQNCQGVVRQEYRQAVDISIAAAPARFKQIMATVNAGFPGMGAKRFCAQMEDEFAKFIQLPSARASQALTSNDIGDLAAGMSEDEVMVTFLVAMTMEYAKCGGSINADQQRAINTEQAAHGELVTAFSKANKGSCQDTIRAYEKARENFARQFAR